MTVISLCFSLQWTNDEDGVARQLEAMERDGCFATA